MIIHFSGIIWYWRGPAPFYFVTVPENESETLFAIVDEITYGWGMVPVLAKVGKTEWKTALWPKDGRYIVPLKAVVRQAENLEEGQEISIRLEVTGS